MKTYRLYQVDAFTKNKFKGNPAGVIPNADGLSDENMQQIARELNNSETVFILSPHGPDHEVHLRYFTPTTEVPVCGHATLAAHYVRALENQISSATVMSKTQVGLLPVEVTQTHGDYRIVMTQGPIEIGPILSLTERQDLLCALGLNEMDRINGHEIQIVSTGHSKVMVGIKCPSRLHTLKPDHQALSALSSRIKCNGYYVYTLCTEEDDVLIHGRMFAPAIGIFEDPVTGNANGPLGAYLVHHQLVPHNGQCFKFKALQGEAIGRVGTIEVHVDIKDNQPVLVKIAGHAVVAFQSELSL